MDPSGQVKIEEAKLSKRIGDLRGKRIALIDIGKPNSKELLESLRLILREKGVGAFLYERKPTHTSPMPNDLLNKLLHEKPDGAILAIAD